MRTLPFAYWFLVSPQQLVIAWVAGVFRPVNTLIRGLPWEDVQ